MRGVGTGCAGSQVTQGGKDTQQRRISKAVTTASDRGVTPGTRRDTV